MLFCGSFFRLITKQLLEQDGVEVSEDWQVRVVNNYCDLNDDDWCLVRETASKYMAMVKSFDFQVTEQPGAVFELYADWKGG